MTQRRHPTGDLGWRVQRLRARPETCVACGRLMQIGTIVLRDNDRFLHGDDHDCRLKDVAAEERKP